MNSPRKPFLALLIALGSVFATAAAAELLPINDNTAPPYLGITESNIYTKAATDFYAWLNRGPQQFVGTTLSFNKGSDWNGIAGASPWFFGPNTAWVEGDRAHRVLVICTPMFPGPPDRSGATTGSCTGPVSFAAGAAGAYDWAFKGVAEQLVAHHMGNSIIRLGWEFNGTWYAWHLNDSAEVADFVTYWKRIVDAMHAVPGASGLKFMWSGSVGSGTPYDIAKAYPEGNDHTNHPYVDYVGVDVYDKCWDKTVYPFPMGASDAVKLECQKKAWSTLLKPWGNNIPQWQAIADSHHVPFCIPEWGLWTQATSDPQKNQGGGGDNPYFIQQMYNYIQDPAHHIYLAAYYDYDTTGNEAKISNVGGVSTRYLKSSALMKQLFEIRR